MKAKGAKVSINPVKPGKGNFVVKTEKKTVISLVGLARPFPKLKALHTAIKADPALAKYFASDSYAKWAQNNALFTHFTGHGDDFVYGPSVEEAITF